MPPKRIALPPDAIAALRQGHTIAAIKILREATGLDLKQAKEAVDAFIEQRGSASVAHGSGLTPEPGVAFPPAVAQALARGDLIDAIKALRAANPQFDLKTAKDLVERHKPDNRATAAVPVERKRVPTVVEGDRGGHGWLWLVALAALFALWYAFSGQG